MIGNGQHVQGEKWRLALLLFAICTLVGLYNFSTFLAQYRMEDENEPVRKILLNEMTAAYSFFLLLPLVLTILKRFPLRKANWLWTVPLHIGASAAYGLAHTTLMTLTRTWLFPVFNLGRYNPGHLFYRYLMEYHKQFLIYAAVGVIVYAVERARAARTREREAAALTLRASNLQAQLADARLQSLQGQLRPHFLFNTLNMISSLMYEDARKADRMMSRLSTLLRMSLDTSKQPCVPLKQEMNILDVYLEIMEARFGSRLRVTRELDAALADVPVPALLLQPLVENAIRHGEPDPDRPIEISVRAQRRGDQVRLEVADNGPGLTDDASGSNGVGLKSVRDRLAQLYGADAHLRLENRSPRGLLVIIELPMPEGGAASGMPAAAELVP